MTQKATYCKNLDKGKLATRRLVWDFNDYLTDKSVQLSST